MNTYDCSHAICGHDRRLSANECPINDFFRMGSKGVMDENEEFLFGKYLKSTELLDSEVLGDICLCSRTDGEIGHTVSFGVGDVRSEHFRFYDWFGVEPLSSKEGEMDIDSGGQLISAYKNRHFFKTNRDSKFSGPLEHCRKTYI